MTEDHGQMIFCKATNCDNNDKVSMCKIRELWIGDDGICTRTTIDKRKLWIGDDGICIRTTIDKRKLWIGDDGICTRTTIDKRKLWTLTPESAMITRFSYVEGLQILTIEFKNGTVYEYYNVPKRIHEGFIEAKSAGKYMHSVIRAGRYECAQRKDTQ